MTTYNAWDGLEGTTGATGASPLESFNFTPGQGEVTNLGLLFTRLFLTYDAVPTTNQGGVTTIPGEIISAEDEAGFVQAPSYSAMSTLYNKAAMKYLKLPTMSKSMPGFDDSPTWTEMTDSVDEVVGRTYNGKPEKITTLEYACPASVKLQTLLTKHYVRGSVWTVIQCYDDPIDSNLYYIVTPRCKLIGVGGNNGENNSNGQLTVKLQPLGGVYVPVYITQARVVS